MITKKNIVRWRDVTDRVHTLLTKKLTGVLTIRVNILDGGMTGGDMGFSEKLKFDKPE